MRWGGRRAQMIGSIVVAAACSGGEARGGPRGGGARPGAASLVLMTYNVNYGAAGDGETIELIRSAGADVVMLQETNPSWEKALRDRLSDRYRHMAFHHSERRAGGLGFLSRHPIEVGEVRASPIGWFPAWRAVVDTPLGRIQLVNLHLRPPGRDRGPARGPAGRLFARPLGGLEWGSFVRAYFTRQVDRLAETEHHVGLVDPELPAILAGDFNEDARGRSLVFLARRGLDSVLERFHPAQPTWRWQTRMGLVRWQLDHILLGPALRATAAWVMDGGASDHVPVLARIERAAP